jgi:hypothetical protein
MMTPKFAFGSALFIQALVGSLPVAMASPDDFEFQLVEPKVKQGEDVSVAVRLIDKRTGHPVADAVIFATRMDMAPDEMESMTTPLVAVLSTVPGIYNFRTNLVMEGSWRLSIAAKIQGEVGTVENRLILKVVP